MTEIETTVKRVVRYEGRHCGCGRVNPCDHYMFDTEDICTRYKQFIGNYETSKAVRLDECVEEFGLNGEKQCQ